MKRFLLFIFFANVFNVLVASNSILAKADSLYLKKEYFTAIKYYEESLKTDGLSSEVYYNLGNAYYRSNILGRAILNYERALKLDPGNTDAKFNLEFVKSKIADEISDDRNFLTRVFDSIINMFNTNTWAYISLVLLILILTSIACYIYSTKIVIRKYGFFSGFVFLFLFCSSILFSLLAANKLADNSRAIIIDKSTVLSKNPQTPKSTTDEVMLLHEGTSIEILDSVQSPNDKECAIWYKTEIKGIQAWIKSTSVERI